MTINETLIRGAPSTADSFCIFLAIATVKVSTNDDESEALFASVPTTIRAPTCNKPYWYHENFHRYRSNKRDGSSLSMRFKQNQGGVIKVGKMLTMKSMPIRTSQHIPRKNTGMEEISCINQLYNVDWLFCLNLHVYERGNLAKRRVSKLDDTTSTQNKRQSDWTTLKITM